VNFKAVWLPFVWLYGRLEQITARWHVTPTFWCGWFC